MAFLQRNVLIIFGVVFLHNTVLDLFLMTDGAEPVFLWDKSLELSTILTHLLIATIVSLVYAFSIKCRELYPQSTLQISDVTWGVCSVCLLLSIVFILF